MAWEDKVNLGDSVELSLSVEDVSANVEFFECLGFTLLEAPTGDQRRWSLLSDGFARISLRAGDAPSPRLTYVTESLGDMLDRLGAAGIAVEASVDCDGKVTMAEFADPSGHHLAVRDSKGAKLRSPSREVNAAIGKFGEYSLPTLDLAKSVSFYESFGFKRVGGHDSEPYPWAILYDDLITVGLHQTDDFGQATITYFATDMYRRIEEVRQRGINLDWSHSDDDGVTVAARISSPGGQPLFLFTGEGEVFGG
jgi:predicted lactoylglutathione lyase